MDNIQFTKIKMDANGNSRVVCGWWNFGTKTYAEAVKLANKIGGRKFNNKTFGGGIVFQLTSTTQLEKQIYALRAEYLKENEPQPEPEPDTTEEGQSMLEFSVILALLVAVVLGAWTFASVIATTLNPLFHALGID